MKITKIESQKNKDRVNIYIDDEFAFGLSLELIYKYHLKKGMDIDENFIKTILKHEEQIKANNYALGFLSHRWRTEKEIRNKMSQKGYADKIIDETISYLLNINLIDDRRFAETYTRDKIRLNKLGSIRIKHELYNKGVSNEIIDEVVSEYCDDEFERALEAGKKKISSYKNDDKNAIYRKLGGFLQRKGYSYECVSRVLKELIK